MTGEQCRAARGWLDWSAQELAERAGVGLATIRRFEAGGDARISSHQKIVEAFQAAGIVFEGPDVIRKVI